VASLSNGFGDGIPDFPEDFRHLHPALALWAAGQLPGIRLRNGDRLMASSAHKKDIIVLQIRTTLFGMAIGAVHQFPVHLRCRLEWLFATGAFRNDDAGWDGSRSLAVVALER